MPTLGLALGLPFTRPSGGGFVGALDDYTTDLATAWSVTRRLFSAFTDPIIKVRRSSDDSLLDIGTLANGLIDSSSLLAFVGAGNGFVHTVYDQSGNGIDLTQAINAIQPKLVTSGVIETNGVYFDGLNFALDTASLSYTNFAAADKVQVLFNLRAENGGANQKLFEHGGGDIFSGWALVTGTTAFWDAPFPTARVNYDPTGFFDVNQTMSFERDQTTSRIRVAGAVGVTGSVSGSISGTEIFRIGKALSGGTPWKGWIKDVAIWKTAASADCVAREASFAA